MCITVKRVSSRESNQETSTAKKAALDGPVYITNRGKPSHVLLTFRDYQCLIGEESSIVDLLAMPAGTEDIEFEPPISSGHARPAGLD